MPHIHLRADGRPASVDPRRTGDFGWRLLWGGNQVDGRRLLLANATTGHMGRMVVVGATMCIKNLHMVGCHHCYLPPQLASRPSSNGWMNSEDPPTLLRTACILVEIGALKDYLQSERPCWNQGLTPSTGLVSSSLPLFSPGTVPGSLAC
jgi:hypothetical protein